MKTNTLIGRIRNRFICLNCIILVVQWEPQRFQNLKFLLPRIHFRTPIRHQCVELFQRIIKIQVFFCQTDQVESLLIR